jgi:probable addiction module antidote protein
MVQRQESPRSQPQVQRHKQAFEGDRHEPDGTALKIGPRMKAPAIPYAPIRGRILSDEKASRAYLRMALKEGGLNEFIECLCEVAQGIGIAKLAQKSGLTRQALYKILYGKGRPQAHSLWQIVEALNLRFDLVEDKKAA